MNIQFIGSTYGGYHIDIDSVKQNDTVLDLGVGTDYSFSESLYRLKKVKIIAVDPTEKSLNFSKEKSLPYVNFINKAIYTVDNTKISLYKNLNTKFVSDSIDKAMKDVGNTSYEADTISINTLKTKYNPTLIKMDIESAEYLVYTQCLGVKQICLETHDYRSARNNSRDIELLNFFTSNNYKIIYNHNHIYTVLLAS